MSTAIAPHHFVSLITLLFGAGFVLPIVWRKPGDRYRASLALALAGSAVSVVAALRSLVAGAAGGTAPPAVLWTSSWLEGHLPPLRWEVRLDSLSAFFVLLIAAFALVVAVYSFAALAAPHYQQQRHHIASAFNLFVWSTLMVVIAHDVFSLIAVLEIMTLAFGYLVLYKHTLYLEEGAPDTAKEHEARIAPQVYLIISHTSTAFLTIALLLLAIPARSLSFDGLRAIAPALDPRLAGVVFLLALVGLGIRAGLTPSHFWVSLVHPSSPTPTHAFSLGIAIKVAVYLMIRFFFEFLPPQPWWGYIVLLVAVATALVNVWYAIASHDLKTALAYHSIENIGIIMAGIGLALIFAARDDPTAQGITALALIASLYHLLNHAVFKGLLYMGTGAIDTLTHQVVEIEKLGGLIRAYPWTAATFLVGSVSIAGFPPFNGFASEWLTLQSSLKTLAVLKSEAFRIETIIVTFSLLLLVASFALTAFCFVKIAGCTLLGMPRTSAETRQHWSPHDVPWTMRGVLVGMALLCLLLGVLPSFIVLWLSSIVCSFLGYGIAMQPVSLIGLSVHVPATDMSLYVMPPTLMVALLLVGAAILVHVLHRKRTTLRPPEPWNCGTPYDPTDMQYTGPALSFLIRGIGTDPLRPVETKQPAEGLPDHFNLTASKAYPQILVETFRAFTNRLIAWMLASSRQTGTWTQNGDIRRYLGYILVANIAVLVLFLLLRGGGAL